MIPSIGFLTIKAIQNKTTYATIFSSIIVSPYIESSSYCLSKTSLSIRYFTNLTIIARFSSSFIYHNFLLKFNSSSKIRLKVTKFDCDFSYLLFLQEKTRLCSLVFVNRYLYFFRLGNYCRIIKPSLIASDSPNSTILI